MLLLETLEQRVTPSLLTPDQIRTAYGINNIQFPGSITGDGSGQTIAIIAQGNDPYLIDSSDTANFPGSDLGLFDSKYALQDPPSFKVVGENGEARPTKDLGYDYEFSSDVEWAHAIAPKASIVVVEQSFDTGTTDTLAGAIATAKAEGATVVSMSLAYGEFPQEINGYTGLDDQMFQAGTTYVASSGDTGAPGLYPAYSPNVLAVGGTVLNLNSDNSYNSETGWSNPSPPEVAILDDSEFVQSPGSYDSWPSITGNFTTTGNWTTSNGDGYNGEYMSGAVGSNATATWTFTNVPTGIPLEVSLSWPSKGGGASSATYKVYDGTPAAGPLLQTLTVDQSKGPIDNTGTAFASEIFEAQLPLSWTKLSSGSLTIVLDEGASSKNGPVYADAVAVSDYTYNGGSGGGISQYEPRPAYQDNLTISNGGTTTISGVTMRTMPDVSFDGYTWVVSVVDGQDSSFAGTSFAAPCWAGLIAIADQGLAVRGQGPLDSTSASGYELQTALYNLPASDFYDITFGFNGYNAGPGYDLVTGLGSPIANLLIPDLASQLVYSAPDNVKDHNIVVKQVGTNIDVTDNGALVAAQPESTISQIDISGSDASGTISLTADYSGGIFNSIPITFDGGTGGGSHSLSVSGSSSLTLLNCDATGANAGDFVVNGISSGKITFIHVQTTTDLATTGTVTLNVDPNNAISGNVTATFTLSGSSNKATLNNNMTNFTFTNPTNALNVNGHLAANTVNFTSLATGFNAPLTVNGNGGSDIVNLNVALTLGHGSTTGSLSVTAATINLGASIDATASTTPGSVNLTGSTALSTDITIKYGGTSTGTSGLSLSELILDGDVNLGSHKLTVFDSASTNEGIITGTISGSGGSLVKSGPGCTGEAQIKPSSSRASKNPGGSCVSIISRFGKRFVVDAAGPSCSRSASACGQ